MIVELLDFKLQCLFEQALLHRTKVLLVPPGNGQQHKQLDSVWTPALPSFSVQVLI